MTATLLHIRKPPSLPRRTDARVHIIRRTRDVDAVALAHALARKGWSIFVSAPEDPEGVNTLVAEIWDAGGSVRGLDSHALFPNDKP